MQRRAAIVLSKVEVATHAVRMRKRVKVSMAVEIVVVLTFHMDRESSSPDLQGVNHSILLRCRYRILPTQHICRLMIILMNH